MEFTQKFVVKIEDVDDASDANIMKLNLSVNRKLCDLLMSYKDMITYYYQNKSWDKFKKLTNEYEFIYSSPSCENNACKYAPISRSFFKMWEILHDFQSDIFHMDKSKPIKCMFLCEGPGGFAEAVMKYRNNVKDDYYGITLKCESNKSIPEWKIGNSVKITYGVDGTGNLYNIDNIKHLSKIVGKKNNCELITADGGFDFSSDFNNQEDMSYKLLACEVLTALYLQKPGGTLILKVFDMFNEKTIKLVHLLHTVYETIYVTKPHTSRPANSEKYLVCTNFKNIVKLKKLRSQLETSIMNEHYPLDIPLHSNVVQKLVHFNTYAVLKQIHYIQRTISLIKQPLSYDHQANVFKNNAILCRQWCKDYDIV